MSDFLTELILRITGDASSGSEAFDKLKSHAEGLPEHFKGIGEQMTSAFEHPVQAVENLAKAVEEKLVSALSMLGPVGEASAIGLAALTAAAGAVSGVLFGLTEHAAKAGEEIEAFSLKTGVAVENVGPLKMAAEAAGGSLQSLSNIARMIEMKEMSDSSGKFAAGLKDMGINAEEFKKQDFQTQLTQLSAGMKEASEKGNAMQDALAIGGRRFAEFIPLLEKMDPELMAVSKTMSQIWTPELIEDSKKFSVDLNLLEQALGQVSTRVGAELLPVMSGLIDAFVKSPEFINGVVAAADMLGHAIGYVVIVVGDLVDLALHYLAPAAAYIVGTWTLWYGLAKDLVVALYDVWKRFAAFETAIGMTKLIADSFGAMKDMVVYAVKTMVEWLEKIPFIGSRIKEEFDNATTTFNAFNNAGNSVKGMTDKIGGALLSMGDGAHKAAAGVEALNKKNTDALELAGKASKATEESVSRTAKMWDEYYQLVAKAAGDTLGAQLKAIDIWYDGQFKTLEKSKALNKNYHKELEALDEVRKQKQEIAAKDEEDREQKRVENLTKMRRDLAGLQDQLTMGGLDLTLANIARIEEAEVAAAKAKAVREPALEEHLADELKIIHDKTDVQRQLAMKKDQEQKDANAQKEIERQQQIQARLLLISDQALAAEQARNLKGLELVTARLDKEEQQAITKVEETARKEEYTDAQKEENITSIQREFAAKRLTAIDRNNEANALAAEKEAEHQLSIQARISKMKDDALALDQERNLKGLALALAKIDRQEQADVASTLETARKDNYNEQQKQDALTSVQNKAITERQLAQQKADEVAAALSEKEVDRQRTIQSKLARMKDDAYALEKERGLQGLALTMAKYDREEQLAVDSMNETAKKEHYNDEQRAEGLKLIQDKFAAERSIATDKNDKLMSEAATKELERQRSITASITKLKDDAFMLEQERNLKGLELSLAKTDREEQAAVASLIEKASKEKYTDEQTQEAIGAVRTKFETQRDIARQKAADDDYQAGQKEIERQQTIVNKLQKMSSDAQAQDQQLKLTGFELTIAKINHEEEAKVTAFEETAKKEHYSDQQKLEGLDILHREFETKRLEAGQKYQEANEQILNKVAQGWGEYAKAVALSDHELLQVQLDSVDQWYWAEYHAIAKSAENNINEWQRLEPLNANYWSRRKKAQDDATKKEQDDVTATGDLWDEYFKLVQGGDEATIQSEINNIEKWRKNEQDKLTASGKAWGEHWDAVNAVADAKINAIKLKHDKLGTDIKAFLAGIYGGPGGWVDTLGQTLAHTGSIKDSLVAVWEDMKKQMLNIFGDLLSSIIHGFLDPLLGQVRSYASSISSMLLSALSTSGPAGGIGTFIGPTLGGTTAGGGGAAGLGVAGGLGLVAAPLAFGLAFGAFEDAQTQRDQEASRRMLYGGQLDQAEASGNAYLVQSIANTPGIAPDQAAAALAWLASHGGGGGGITQRQAVENIVATSPDPDAVAQAVAWLSAHPMAEGGLGTVKSPTLFLAGVHGSEDYAFSGEGKSFGRSGMTVNVYVAGSVQKERDLAASIAQRIADQYLQVGGAMPLNG